MVIMALAATRPIVGFAEAALRRVASAGSRDARGLVGAILTSAPLLGSFITEPAAMTICALLLRAPVLRSRAQHAAEVRDARAVVRERLDRRHADAFRRAARADGGAALGLGHRRSCSATSAGAPCWRSCSSTLVYFVVFRRELADARHPAARPDVDEPEDPAWHRVRRCCRSGVDHGRALASWRGRSSPRTIRRCFVGGFLIFLGFAQGHGGVSEPASSSRRRCSSGSSSPDSSSTAACRAGGLRRCSASLSETPLFLGADAADGVQRQRADHLSRDAGAEPRSTTLKIAVVQGAVAGGGLTVIANAPNPAGQALLERFFDGAISPLGLLLAALPPTLIAAICFRVL